MKKLRLHDISSSHPLFFFTMASLPPTHSAPGRDQKSFLAGGMAIIWAIALAKLVFPIYFNSMFNSRIPPDV